MQDSEDGEPGQIITRGGNVMSSYVGNPEATKKALHHIDGGLPWYVNLGDVGFTLVNPFNGLKDFYWLSRDSALLIRGGRWD
jgi:acyl-CoA synthetase (AMP-forming)/AMP-acid ligase II